MANGIITVSPGGFINDEAAKQLVLNFNVYNPCIVKTPEEEIAVASNGKENSLSLPLVLNQTTLAGKGAAIMQSQENRSDFWVGSAVPESCISEYIKNFYPDYDDPGNAAKKLVASKILNVQLSFCTGGSGFSFDSKIVGFSEGGLVNTIEIDSNLLLNCGNTTDISVSTFDASNKEYKINGITLKAVIAGPYNINNGSISGFNIAEVTKIANYKKIPGEQNFKRMTVSCTRGNTVRARFYVDPSYKSSVDKIIQGGIPEGLYGRPMPYYNEVTARPNGPIVAGCTGMADAAEKWHGVLVNRPRMFKIQQWRLYRDSG